MRPALPLLALFALPCCQCGEELGLSGLEARLEIEPRSVDFGEAPVGARIPATVTLRSLGSGPADVASTLVGGAFAFAERPPTTLPAQTETRLTLFFAPYEEGPFEGRLTVTSASLDGGSVSVQLTGRGLAAVPCDDSPCRRAEVDLQTGACVVELLSGPCGEGDPCLVGGTCADGRCVGSPVDCGPPPAACYAAACAAPGGCSFTPVAEACDDGDPCTEDRCTEEGCVSTTLPDGALCAEPTCATIQACQDGACVSSPTPEGFTCSDDDACTEADQCVEGACRGTPVESGSSTRVGELRTFGAPGALAVALPGDRVVFRDANPYGGEVTWTVIRREGPTPEDVVLESQTSVAGPELDPPVALVATGLDGTFFGLGAEGGARLYGSAPQVFEIVDVPPAAFTAVPPRPVGVSLQDGRIARCGHPAETMGVVVVPSYAVGDPEQPTLLPLPSPCEALASGAGRLWAVGADGALYELDPDGAGESAVLSVLPGQYHLVAADGERLVTVTTDTEEFLADDVVEVYETGTAGPGALVQLGSFPVPVGGGVSAGVRAVHVLADTLFVLSTSDLRVLDLSELPGVPLITQYADGASFSPAISAVFSSNESLVVRSGTDFYRPVHLLDRQEGFPQFDHPRLGSVLELHAAAPSGPSGGEVVALHRQGIRVLEPDAEGGPVLVWGGRRVDDSNSLWSLGPPSPTAPPARFPIGHRHNGTFTGWQPLRWLELAPDAFSEVGVAFDPFLSGVSSVASDGRRAFALRMSSEDEAHLDVFDLGAMAASVSGGPPTVATLALGWPGADRNTFSHIEVAMPLPAPGEEQLAGAVMQRDWDFDTPAAERSSVVALVSFGEQSISVLAQGPLPGLSRQAWVLDDDALLVNRALEGWFGDAFDGEELLRVAHEGDQLLVDATLPIEGLGNVVWSDETRALVSHRGGASFVAHGPGELTLVGPAPVFEPPTHALEVGGVIWAAGPHGVSALRPPCP